MALSDILIPENDAQHALMEIPAGTAGTPFDALNDKNGIIELILSISENSYPRSRIVNT